jgi:Obg family GTPase CgtA
MFVDVAKIHIKAGNGGNGVVAFHREKYVAAGGPDGGDGGRGGSIIFVKDDNLSTLMDFKYKRKYAAQSGEDGRGSNQSGKKGEDLTIRVPRGTLIKDAETGAIIADISTDEPVIIAKGGKGGLGNQHFATPTRQVPTFAKPGIPGEEFDIILELKLIADVGLIGFPNVGKSTIISVISAAKPKIANYHFTTLTPVLGVVRVDEEASFVAADIPGIIEGASDGAGLGHAFLRHVERCRLLVHVVDISGSEGRDPKEDFELINSELKNFSVPLSLLPQIVVGNKSDIANEEQIQEFKEFVEKQGYAFYAISAATMQNMGKLPGIIYEELQKLPPVKTYEVSYVKPEPNKDTRAFSITREAEDLFEVDAEWLVRILNGSNIEDYESLQYFQRQLMDSGVIDALKEKGADEGDTIRIGEYEFEFIL